MMTRRWCASTLAGGLVAFCSGSGAVFAGDIDFFGLLQLDALDVHAADNQQLSAGNGLRALKTGIKARLSERLDTQVELAVSSSGDVSLDDSFVRYRLGDNMALSFGYLKIYHTLSAATSETVGGLPERSLASNAFEVGTGGQLGVFLQTGGGNWSVQTGVSFDDLNDDTADTNGWGLHARATYAPILAEEAFLHVGLSAYYRDEDDNLLFLSARPEAWLDGGRMFASGLVEADHYRHANIELATSSGPWLFDAEYGGLRTKGREAHSYDGGHIAASYVLTGEHRAYDAGAGKLKAFSLHDR
ncbi:porin [Kordiimonas lipolytica]|uniref:Porin n=2 Tax=Kordiimonas lipolytica TaxID=1662421 RepID=A0ABV8UEA1_9PROT